MATTPIQDGSPNVNGIATTPPADVEMQARELLEQLCAARQLTEQRLAEAGRFDPIKKVTGRSSLDIAIERTERLLEEMRELTTNGVSSGDRSHCMVEIDQDACHTALNGNVVRQDAWRRNQAPALALAP